MRALILGSALAIVATAAVAQNLYDNGRYNYYGHDLTSAYAYGPYENGENRDTAFGQGGTAGTHPTGANVGPGRAQMVHSN